MLKGVVALVTGGASGLGKATVRRVIRQGGRAVVCDLKSSQGAEVAENLGNDALFVPTDVSLPTDVENALGMCKDKFGRLDCVINCAGVASALAIYNPNNGNCSKMEDFERLQRVNVCGTFNVIRLSAALMAENEPDADGQRGVIVNTSSISAFEGQYGQSTFSASQGAIVGMTLPIARDLASVGIRVCTIAPDLFSTPLNDHLPTEVREFFAHLSTFPKRLGHPDEYAHLVQSIITNPMLNGEVIRLDGGLRTKEKYFQDVTVKFADFARGQRDLHRLGFSVSN